jgi:NDP-sugar pyrophosphorylase family protein
MIVVIPMAGKGTRFSSAGYDVPKPLIEINGKPMVYYAYQSLVGLDINKLIFIALKEHDEQFNVKEILNEWIDHEFELILINNVTRGQLQTVLLAEKYFTEDESVLIVPCDTYVESNIAEEIEGNDFVDGIISVFDLPGDNWSFAGLDHDGYVKEVTEKERISEHASTGIYYFKNAHLFKFHATNMIEENDLTQGEFYVMPVYKRFITGGAKIIVSKANNVWDMGNPMAKNNFEKYLKKFSK